MFWQEKKEEDIIAAQRKQGNHSTIEKRSHIQFKPIFASIASIFVIVATILFLFKVDDISDRKENQYTPPATEVPANGTMFYPFSKYDGDTAPLTIKTKGDGYYYVKLKDSESGKNKFIFFVHGGRTVELNVPLGDYLLYYAHGDEWYGTSDLFGPDTVYFKADEVFDFYMDGNGELCGWTVELYLQENGNLDVDTVSVAEF